MPKHTTLDTSANYATSGLLGVKVSQYVTTRELLTLTFLNTRFLLISFSSSRFSKSRALSLHFFVICTIIQVHAKKAKITRIHVTEKNWTEIFLNTKTPPTANQFSWFWCHFIRHAPCQCVAKLATNSLHSDLSKASSIASSKVRLCRDRSLFKVAI